MPCRLGGEVTPFYDSMLGKLIVHGATRAQAIDGLIAALDGTQLLGLPTNRAFLTACLAHPVFRSGQALIPFLADHGDAIRKTLQDERSVVMLPAAIGLHFAATAGAAQTLPCPFGKALRLLNGAQELAITVTETGVGQLQIASGSQQHSAACVRTGSGDMQVTVDGLSRTVRACQVADGRWHVQVGATDIWLMDASLAPAAGASSSSQALDLRAPFNGKVIGIQVAAGQAVKRGDTLLVIESMKLEHALCATRDVVVAALAVETGQQTATGQVLLRFEHG